MLFHLSRISLLSSHFLHPSFCQTTSQQRPPSTGRPPVAVPTVPTVPGLVAQGLAVAVAQLQLRLGGLAAHGALRQDAPRQLARGEGGGPMGPMGWVKSEVSHGGFLSHHPLVDGSTHEAFILGYLTFMETT